MALRKRVQERVEQSQELSESLNKFNLETVSALTPPTGDPLGPRWLLQTFGIPTLWPAERLESWVRELVSPLPQKRGQESEGIPGQLENYRAGESGQWYFPGSEKDLWEQEGLVCPASEE